MAVTDKYQITISGTGVTAADATTAFEAAVLALRGDTAEGGLEPSGTLRHTEIATEHAEDVEEGP